MAYKPNKLALLLNLITLAIGLTFTSLPDRAIAQDKTLRIGVDGTFPPYTHVDINGKFSGFDIDVAKGLCKLLKKKCVFQRFDWLNLAAAVRAGKVDLVISAVSIRDEQRKLLTFSTSYLQVPINLAIRNDSLLIAVTPQELVGAHIGVLKSTPQFEYAKTYFAESKITQYDNRDAYQLDLANGKIDAIADDPILIDQWLKSSDGQNCCRLLGSLAYDPQINGEGFGIAMAQDRPKLLKSVNKALDKMRENGELAKLRQSHLPFLN